MALCRIKDELPPPPRTVAPFDATQAKKHQQAWADHLGVPVEYTNSVGIKFRVIPPGETHIRGENTERKVTVSEPFPPGEFLMGSTQAEKICFLEEAKSTVVRAVRFKRKRRARGTHPFSQNRA